MLRPTAFMDIWVDQLIANDIREKGVATIFGDGNTVANYIAVDDVAEFAVRILERDDVVNEAVDVGGPSNVSQNRPGDAGRAPPEVRRAGAATCRLLAMRLLPPLVRPFNEVAARMMTLGLYAATQSQPFPEWKKSADRFGVSPRTVETYVDQMS